MRVVAMKLKIFTLLALAPLALARADDAVKLADKPPTAKKAAKPSKELAVIVNPKNPVKKITFSELRSYLKLRRQFWPNKKRCDLYLPPHKSDAYKLLLKDVYKTSHKKLQKYWVRKLFSGDIPSKPSYVSSFRSAGSQVLKNVGALSIVPANMVPKGVRVLPIDGKMPGDKGYRLAGK